MNQWWQWGAEGSAQQGGFAVIGVGRFGSSVCAELLRSGAEVLAIDQSQRAIDELRHIDAAIEARVVDCTDEEALRAAGVLDLGVTANLNRWGQLVLMVGMFVGRIGILLLLSAIYGSRPQQRVGYPKEDLYV